jgi:DNA-binding PadR family transcriptional regulator
MSGKELIDKAVAESGGVWKASPGLIYHILGRLIEEGLIDQMDDGSIQNYDEGFRND